MGFSGYQSKPIKFVCLAVSQNSLKVLAPDEYQKAKPFPSRGIATLVDANGGSSEHFSE